MNTIQAKPEFLAITRGAAHVIDETNLFVHSVLRIGADTFESPLLFDGRHPYLYDNPAIANHVSGTSFLDASRQLLKAISHLYYNVPIENRFVIQKVEMNFARWAKIGVEIRALVEAEALERVLGGVASVSVCGKITFQQEGRELGSMTGKFSTFSAEVEARLMSRQYRQPPVIDQAVAA
ncbi:AfsA-related hotdog domain-containing protein [Methylosinus sp. PW1]|uniref:AfsA-related hotdog domain-containing protein n=1 Tax=Methylosinus sp. PW1 TaxID=107636 RepID=UPI000561D830|nr:AfsA-related hotdog domain-containing protein [Methylosinus sp. PW1]